MRSVRVSPPTPETHLATARGSTRTLAVGRDNEWASVCSHDPPAGPWLSVLPSTLTGLGAARPSPVQAVLLTAVWLALTVSATVGYVATELILRVVVRLPFWQVSVWAASQFSAAHWLRSPRGWCDAPTLPADGQREKPRDRMSGSDAHPAGVGYTMDREQATGECTAVVDSVKKAVISDREFLETVLTGLLARGHVLLEDVPGTGKTLTARSMATALGLSFSRIQFTPDLLPADVTGTYIFNEQDREFEFRPGPVFNNVVLADEINRAPPKTQSALLEAMEERQVSVDGDTHELPEPFFVIATQNPVEQEGTFALPEAQIDRFMVKTSLGYPEFDGELTLLERRDDRSARSPGVESVLSTDEVLDLQEVPESVRVDEDLMRYAIEITRATRNDHRVAIGVSPRGSQRLFEAARAHAVLAGEGFVTPDTIKRMAQPVLAHRLVLTADAQVNDIDKRDIVADVLDEIPVPTVG